MKAAVIDEFGPPSVLQIRDIETPSIGPDQILIEVHAAGVNPIDWKIRDGQMAMRFAPDFPKILGFDVSGTVAEVGAEVSGFDEGDPVYARSNLGPGGCYAEYVAVNGDTVAEKPDELSFEEAAAMPLAAITALKGLRDCGEISEGSRVLIIGASGGVGIYAVQIAKILGAHVTAVCSTRNISLVSDLGANHIIDYTREDALKSDEPYDVIYDTVGTQSVEGARKVLTANGVYMTLVPVEGIEFFVPGQTKREPHGAYFVAWEAKGEDLDVLSGWVRTRKLTSIIDSVFPLDEIKQAHEKSETLRARGKIIIKVKDA